MLSPGEEEVDKENLQAKSLPSTMPIPKSIMNDTSNLTNTTTNSLTKHDTVRRGGEMFNIPVNDIGVLERNTTLYENRHVVKLPILHLGLFQSPLTVDFRNVMIGEAKTVVVQCSIPSNKTPHSAADNKILKLENSSSNNDEKMVLQETKKVISTSKKMILSSTSTQENLAATEGQMNSNGKNRKVTLTMTKIPKEIRVDAGDITLTKEQQERFGGSNTNKSQNKNTNSNINKQSKKVRSSNGDIIAQSKNIKSESTALKNNAELENFEILEGDKLSITWSPTEVDSMRKTLQFTLNGKHRLQLVVQGKGILNEQAKKGNKKAVINAYRKDGGSIYSSSFGGGSSTSTSSNMKTAWKGKETQGNKMNKNVDPVVNQIHQCKVDFNSSLDEKLNSILSVPESLPPALINGTPETVTPAVPNKEIPTTMKSVLKIEREEEQKNMAKIKVGEFNDVEKENCQLLPPSPPKASQNSRKDSITAMFIPSEISLDEENRLKMKTEGMKGIAQVHSSTSHRGGMLVDIAPENCPMSNCRNESFKVRAEATHDNSSGSTVMNDGVGHLPKRASGKTSVKKITASDIRKNTQETRLTEWLNFTLNPSQLSAYKAASIPAKPFEGASTKCKVDVPSGCISFLEPSRTSTASGSESRQSSTPSSKKTRRASGGVGDVSLNLTQRISNLEIASAIYTGEEFQAILSQLENEVKQDRKIKIRDDKDIYADLELRGNFIDMMMSYEQVWLVLALETIFPDLDIRKMRKVAKDGQILCLSTDQVLKKVLIDRVLKDPAITKKYFHNSKVRVLSGKFQTAYRKELSAHTICKFLQIVLLLDQCKLSNEIMPHRKSLFRSTLSGAEDGNNEHGKGSMLSKMKKTQSISRSAKANKFDVKSSETLITLFSRDFLYGEGNIIRHLGNSCGFEVFFEQHYTDEFDYRVTNLSLDLRDGIRLAKLTDILSGVSASSSVTAVAHDSGELCYKLRLPAQTRTRKLYNVDLVLQCQATLGLARKSVVAKDIVDGNREKTLELLWGIVSHFNLNLLVESLTGLLRFQATVRAYILRKRFLLAKNLALSLQRLYRNKKKITFHFNKMPIRKAIILLQRTWRAKQHKRMMEIYQENVVIVQASVRAFLARKYFSFLLAKKNHELLQLEKSVIIQKYIRKFIAAKKYYQVRNGFVKMQAIYKMRTAYRSYQHTKEQIVVLQAYIRMKLAKIRLSNMLKASIRMQAFIKMCIYKKRYNCARELITCLQRRMRSKILQRKRKEEISKIVLIQAQIRMITTRASFKRDKSNAIKIQSFVRMLLVRKRYYYVRQKIIFIQSKCRSIQKRKFFVRTLSNIILLQSCFRSHLARQRFTNTMRKIVLIQSLARRYFVKMLLLENEKAAFCIQYHWRQYILQKEKHHSQIIGATKIQALYRGWQIRKRYELVYQKVIYLQSTFRATIMRRRYTILKESTVQIQSLFRMHLAKIRYQLMREKVTYGIIQFQACIRGVQGRQRYIQEYFAARQIQSIIRMHLCRKWYLLTLKRIVKVQALARTFIVKQRVIRFITVITWFQHIFRQKKFRAKMEKQIYQVVMVQSLVKGFLVRRLLNKQRIAQSVLFKWITGFLIRKRYQKIRNTALVIQSTYRAQRVRKERSKKMSAIHLKLKQANDKARADPSLLIGNRNKAALDILMNSKSCALILYSCATLDVSTRLSQSCCEALCQVGGVGILFNLIRNCNRSKPHMELVCHALRVIQNLCVHDHLLPYVIADVNQTEMETKNKKTTSKKLLEAVVGEKRSTLVSNESVKPELSCSESDIFVFSDTVVGIMASYRENKDLFFPAALILVKFSTFYPQVKASFKNPEIEKKLSGLYNIFSRSTNSSFKTHLNSSSKRIGPKISSKGVAGSAKAASRVYGYTGSSGMSRKENINSGNQRRNGKKSGFDSSQNGEDLTPLMLIQMLIENE